jgi:hypothetical protein
MREHAIDLHTTDDCPIDTRCANCAAVGDVGFLQITTATSVLGVHCVTLCLACMREGLLPPMAPVHVVALCLAHCGHLDIDADEMADALAVEHAGEVSR